MAAKELVDEHVSANQCKLAVEALLKHEKQREEKLQESELLPGKEQHVWLQITVKQMHPEKKLKPHKMCVLSNRGTHGLRFDFLQPSRTPTR